MITCPACGTDNPEQARFCMACAASLTLRSPPADQRKTVTTLFCDLVGFTAMSEAADPEEIDARLRAYFAQATRVIEEHGGTVEKFIGDAVVGVFGVPVVYEDDPERAVRAGLALVSGLAGLTRPDGEPLQARVGVNTGLAVVRLDVAPGSGEGFLTGDAVNVAARLQAAASPMGVVVGELTHDLTAATFVYDEIEPLFLKGKTVRVKAWLAREPAAEAGTRRAPSTAVPLVGRKGELATCLDAVSRLRDGQGGLLLVSGEAGIGKTRLVEELREAATREGCAWLQGHTLSFGRSISYWPFLEILQQAAGITSDDAEDARVAKLTARVTALFGEQSREVLPYLATLLALPVPEEFAERIRHADGEAMGQQVYRAARLYVARLAEERPVVVTYEDVHWMDASSAALLEHLLPLMAEVPVLFCCVSRPELDSPIDRLQELARSVFADRAAEIRLQALSSAESVTLVRQLARTDELPAGLRDAILAKAQGNPFFVEEIVRSFIDLGGLERVAATGGYQVTSLAYHIAIPDTLLAVIMARVDRLDEDLKEVLRLASVIGRRFFYSLLVAISDADRDLDDSLAGLQARELVLEKARDPELEYLFKHALVREATYDSILLQRRRDLHRRVAAAVEQLFAGQLDELFGLLAYHYSKAEDWEKAQEYLLRAGDQAGSIAADAEALAHYRDAMDAYTRAFGDNWDPLEKAALERKMGEALYRRGEQALATEYLFRALQTLGSPFPASPGALRRATAAQVLRQVWHRLLARFFARRLPPDAVRLVEERCRVYYMIVWSNMFADANVWLLGMLLCLNEGERAGLEWAASGGASAMAMALHTIPAPRLFKVYIRRARALAEQGRLDYQRAHAALITGMFAFWVEGDFTAALETLERAAGLYRRLGDTRLLATAMGTAIHVPAESGELAQGLLMSREIIRLGVETGDRLTEVWGQAWEAELLYLTGDLAAGEAGMRRSVDEMVAMMDYRIGAKVAGRLAACLLAQGKLEEADVLLDEHRKRLREFGIRGGLSSSVVMGVAAADLMRAELSQGAARGAALKEARRACRAARRQAKADKTALVPAWRMQGTLEWLQGRTSKADDCWRKSLHLAERIGCRLEGALTMLEMGRRMEDRGRLEQAEAEFAAMGARFFLTQTKELLGQPAG